MSYDTAHLSSPGQCDPPTRTYLNLKITKPTGEVVYSGVIDAEGVIFDRKIHGPQTAKVTIPAVDFMSRLEEAVKPKEEE